MYNEENEIKYSHHDSFEYTTSDPDEIERIIREKYPERDGYKVTIDRVPSTGSISFRGETTLKIKVEQDERFKKAGKHF